MKLSRQMARKKALEHFKHVQTCILAQELCIGIRRSRAILEPGDVKKYCLIISKLCSVAGCKKQSKLCSCAANIVSSDEKQYLEFCAASCKLCAGSSLRKAPKPSPNIYVA